MSSASSPALRMSPEPASASTRVARTSARSIVPEPVELAHLAAPAAGVADQRPPRALDEDITGARVGGDLTGEVAAVDVAGGGIEQDPAGKPLSAQCADEVAEGGVHVAARDGHRDLRPEQHAAGPAHRDPLAAVLDLAATCMGVAKPAMRGCRVDDAHGAHEG